MSALVVLFNLKDQAAKDAYEEFARNVDVPTVKGLNSITDFKVYRLNEVMGTGDKPPYEYCEVIDISDMAGLGPELETEKMQSIAAQFQEFADNPTFIVSEQFA